MINTSVSYPLSLNKKRNIDSIIVKFLRFYFYNNHTIRVKIFSVIFTQQKAIPLNMSQAKDKIIKKKSVS